MERMLYNFFNRQKSLILVSAVSCRMRVYLLFAVRFKRSVTLGVSVCAALIIFPCNQDKAQLLCHLAKRVNFVRAGREICIFISNVHHLCAQCVVLLIVSDASRPGTKIAVLLIYCCNPIAFFRVVISLRPFLLLVRVWAERNKLMLLCWFRSSVCKVRITSSVGLQTATSWQVDNCDTKYFP